MVLIGSYTFPTKYIFSQRTCEYLGDIEAILWVPSGPGDIGKFVASRRKKDTIKQGNFFPHIYGI